MTTQNITLWQWILVIASSLVLIAISPWAKTKSDFFQATRKDNQKPGLWLLTSSLVISWIFAKSITNAANLGLSYGIVGGVAYATYYLSFLFAGIIIFKLRVKGGFQSIHQFLSSKYGRGAVILFSILIAFRLFNEVWSNTIVIGSYFGEVGSKPYYLAILVFTLLTLLYSLKGGLSSSMLTDAIQMVLFAVLLCVILGVILPDSNGVSSYLSSGDWSLTGGVDLLLVALIQSISYPFHDPVMTDRGFITDPQTMKKAFYWAVPIGFICIVLFSFIGVYATQKGMEGEAAVEVAQSLGIISMLVINLIMITSASSTLDSAFASFSKLMAVDLKIGNASVSSGRLIMVLIAVLGTIPVFFNPTVLSATTISGTMVIGLAPVFIFWRWKVHRLAFVLTVLTGTAFGIWFATGAYPKEWVFFPGSYGDLLSVNLLGTAACFLVFIFMKRKGNALVG
ncbi:sodium:solute symporter [Roseivirga sp. UBA838]|uniref:sodium:solute symporter family transporter n=1 Tax=Roseivirga sp. UBA838 TaxID=1947393 RepID=UPI002580E162|nr:sodium:solute symporter [Roseivirga sp. UBA838]|tara:strand:+ start:25174 stop:26532 length:1359 start_codon:yes stop_codon:yes gene_type:complete